MSQAPCPIRSLTLECSAEPRALCEGPGGDAEGIRSLGNAPIQQSTDNLRTRFWISEGLTRAKS